MIGRTLCELELPSTWELNGGLVMGEIFRFMRMIGYLATMVVEYWCYLYLTFEEQLLSQISLILILMGGTRNF